MSKCIRHYILFSKLSIKCEKIKNTTCFTGTISTVIFLDNTKLLNTFIQYIYTPYTFPRVISSFDIYKEKEGGFPPSCA